MGGYIVAQGTVEDIKNNPESITGQYLSGKSVLRFQLIGRNPMGNG